MRKLMVANSQFTSQNRQRIIQLCFDARTIHKFKPGLKMIFAIDDPPIFVKLEEIESDAYDRRPTAVK